MDILSILIIIFAVISFIVMLVGMADEEWYSTVGLLVFVVCLIFVLNHGPRSKVDYWYNLERNKDYKIVEGTKVSDDGMLLTLQLQDLGKGFTFVYSQDITDIKNARLLKDTTTHVFINKNETYWGGGEFTIWLKTKEKDREFWYKIGEKTN